MQLSLYQQNALAARLESEGGLDEAYQCLQAAADSRASAIEAMQEAKRSLARANACVAWLEARGESEAAAAMSLANAVAYQPLINAEEREAKSAAIFAAWLQGCVYAEDAAANTLALYCMAVAVSVGKGGVQDVPTAGQLRKRLKARYALLQRLQAGIDADLAESRHGLHSENVAAYSSALASQLAALPTVERRATMQESLVADAATWQATQALIAAGALHPSAWRSISVSGNPDALAAAFKHAYVQHNARGTVGTNKEEREADTVRRFKAQTKHLLPMADHDSTAAQAYVHDDTGARLIAPFPRRPQVQRKHCRKLAELSPVIKIK